MVLHAAINSNTEEVLRVYERPYTADGTKRPCIWLHSAGSTISTEPWTAANSLPHLSALAETLHLPIIAPAMGGVTWGNDTAQSFITDALAYLRTKGAHSSLKPILVGLSMGGMAALNWARANPTLVQAIALFYPAVNLQAIHDGTGGAADGHVTTEAAYGGSLANFNAAVAAHDPAQHATSYQSFPIKMWYSTNDTTVGTTNQTNFATAVGGSNFTSRSLGSVSHADMTQIDPTEVSSFLAAYV